MAQTIDPSALSRLAAGREVVLVTGTNGKTTTAHMLAAALRARGPVAHNATGANMADGALAALMAAPSARTAVLEVDELHLGEITAAVSPAAVVLLNLSRDQLDRSTEVAAVAASIRSALSSLHGTTVLANCDDPLVTAVAAGVPDVQWFAGGGSWRQDSTLCPRCGHPLDRQGPHWRCPSCGSARPRPDWDLSGAGASRAAARDANGSETALAVRLPGDYNLRNALAAVAAAAALRVEPAHTAAAIAEVRSVAHRYSAVDHEDHRLVLLLAKNPAGWRETLPLADPAPARLLVVNAREADGRDTSWLWDVPFEDLPPAPTAAAGESAADLGQRLTYAGIRHTTAPDPLAALATLPSGTVVVVANYTAFADLCQRLQPST